MCQCLISYNHFEFSRQVKIRPVTNGGLEGQVPPPSFWQISQPYLNQVRGHIIPIQYYVPLWIFRPYDGPFFMILLIAEKMRLCNCSFFFLPFLQCSTASRRGLLNNECYSFFNALAFLVADSLFLRYII